jgi:hypothetical protein
MGDASDFWFAPILAVFIAAGFWRAVTGLTVRYKRE